MNRRQDVVTCLEGLIDLLENRVREVGGSVFVSPQQPFGDVAGILWQVRRGGLSKLRYLALLLAQDGPISYLAKANGWRDEFTELQLRFEEAFRDLNRVRYHGTERPVDLGDHVQLRVLFRQRQGRVTYLPGKSSPNDEIDFGGLFRVGIQVQNGPFVAVHVDPETLEVKKGVRFLRSDSTEVPAVPTPEELQE